MSIIPGVYAYKITDPNGIGNPLQPRSYLIVYRILVPKNESKTKEINVLKVYQKN